MSAKQEIQRMVQVSLIERINSLINDTNTINSDMHTPEDQELYKALSNLALVAFNMSCEI